MKIEGLEGVTTSMCVIDNNQHHRFYFQKDGHFHSLDLVITASELAKSHADPVYADKVNMGLLRDANEWFKEANAYGQKR